MPTPLEYMQLRAPDFAARADIQDWLGHAELETGSEYCNDDMRNKAVFLLAAHWLALDARNSGGAGIGVVGSVKSEKEGDLARSYGMSGNDESVDPYLAQTSWGLELYNLQRSCFLLPRHRFI